ncbi:hypothetical protein MF1_11270 [Bartonella quintana]|nr:hypothetical protein MF1_11270 [Bartonella quintana]
MDKKAYNSLLSGNYVEDEKAFCAFRRRYEKGPLSDDALFWLAEALLGQNAPMKQHKFILLYGI